MSSQVALYLSRIASSLASGHATEHTYRPAQEELFKYLTNLVVHNEPKRSEHGAPDFVFTQGMFPIAYAEAKDVDVSLEKIEKGEQLARYFGYPKLILTNGTEFRFYKNGVRYGEPVSIATKSGNIITSIPDAFGVLERTTKDFLDDYVDTIRSAKHLAKIMGGKALRIRDNLREMLNEENRTAGKYPDLFALYDIFKKEILHDLDYHNFADLYAQTLVYGLFVARYNDVTPDNFTRIEARDLVPKSNPLLRKFFDHIAGEGFEKRLGYIVDELCDVFAHADVRALMHGLYQKTDIETHDPVIHFYEDFLGEYDSKLRMARGVFYTPAPVVQFIVRAVDEILKTHFGLKRGLADTSKIKHETMGHVTDKRGKMSTKSLTEEVHRVQILDPATGTGTFLNEVVRHIHESMKDQAGIWPSYVKNDLIPRLHGFELMMASYTIAHLKLGLTLAETGVTDLDQRLQIYLTNSLEEAKTTRETRGTVESIGLQASITNEGYEADDVKADKPIMVIVGNPPYSGISTNNGAWITNKIEDYKYVNGEHFGEKKHWLQDDYVKFFRLAESLVEKNEEGVLGFITNHGYLDNPTFRGMRWHLLQTFDHIYIVDLHGNSKKKETAPDGSKDENVFDIQQGVAIFIGVKTGKKKTGECAEVLHIDQYGKRGAKYDWLEKNTLETSIKLTPQAPYYFFVPKDLTLDGEYQKGINIGELFTVNVTGIVTARDGLVIAEKKEELLGRMKKFFDENKSDNDIRSEFFGSKKEGKYLTGDSRGWQLSEARKNLRNENHEENIREISYRPFDTRYVYYHPKMVDWGRERIMKHALRSDNLSLVIPRQAIADSWSHVQIIRSISDNRIHYSNKGISLQCPLYLYSDSENLENQTRTPNLDEDIWSAINAIVGETTPEQILDYIYAVLHSPSYREKYREFLKIDFPRVPYPRDRESFLALVALGGELRSLHLLESPKVEDFITSYPVAGDNVVESVKYVDEKVFINTTQYFGGVPESVWTHPIGGYMPAQKWLKDRKGRTLTNGDIMHYQRMIVALAETARVRGEVDGVI